MSIAEAQAAQVSPPLAGTSQATTGSSTSAVDISAFRGRWIIMISSTKTHIIFGASNVAAAQTSDIWLPADMPTHYYIPKNGTRDFFRAINASGNGVINYAASSDA